MFHEHVLHYFAAKISITCRTEKSGGDVNLYEVLFSRCYVQLFIITSLVTYDHMNGRSLMRAR